MSRTAMVAKFLRFHDLVVMMSGCLPGREGSIPSGTAIVSNVGPNAMW
jgi:hypothetical protein